MLLAAGEGSRFGQPKALVELNGQTLAERGVGLLRAGGADPVLVVTGAARIELDDAHIVYNEHWRSGMGSSLRAALRALTQAGEAGQAGTGAPGQAGAGEAGQAGAGAPGQAGTREPGPGGTGKRDEPPALLPAAVGADVGAVVVALADQPLVGAEAVARLIAAYRAGAGVAVAGYDGRPRNPVLIAREHWPEVAAMATGDRGARAFLRARPDLVTLVECGDTGRPDDIDTAADLARIAARTGGAGRRRDRR